MNERYNDFVKFQKTWGDLHMGSNPRIDPLFVKGDLDICYNESGRYYHNARHINEGLLELDAVRHLLKEKSEAEIAWYFHDSDYDARAKDNEEKSAERFSNIVARSGISRLRISKVRRLILATKHLAIPSGGDAQIIVDVDLSILGKPEKVFDEYERNISEEYSWVEEETFIRENCIITLLAV